MPGARRPEQACAVPASRQCVCRRAAGTAQACSGLRPRIARISHLLVRFVEFMVSAPRVQAELVGYGGWGDSADFPDLVFFPQT